MSGVSVGPTKFLMARPKWVTEACLLAEEAALGIERAQHHELVVAGGLGHRHRRGLAQREAGVVADLLDARAGMGRLDPHAARLGLEAQDAERRHHAGDAAEEQAGPGAGA